MGGANSVGVHILEHAESGDHEEVISVFRQRPELLDNVVQAIGGYAGTWGAFSQSRGNRFKYVCGDNIADLVARNHTWCNRAIMLRRLKELGCTTSLNPGLVDEAKEKAAKEKAAKQKAAKEKEAKEKAAKEKEAKEKEAKEKQAKEKAPKEKAAKEAETEARAAAYQRAAQQRARRQQEAEQASMTTPSRMADQAGTLDFSLVSAICPDTLKGAPDLSFAEAVAAPIQKYGLRPQLLVDVQLKVN